MRLSSKSIVTTIVAVLAASVGAGLTIYGFSKALAQRCTAASKRWLASFRQPAHRLDPTERGITTAAREQNLHQLAAAVADLNQVAGDYARAAAKRAAAADGLRAQFLLFKGTVTEHPMEMNGAATHHPSAAPRRNTRPQRIPLLKIGVPLPAPSHAFASRYQPPFFSNN